MKCRPDCLHIVAVHMCVQHTAGDTVLSDGLVTVALPPQSI